MPTVLTEQSETALPTARTSGDDLWIAARDAGRATGWTLQPEGCVKAVGSGGIV